MTHTDICIIGAGLSGLALATFLRQAAPSRSLLVLERDARPGGAIKSFRRDGWLAEWGAHGFLDNREEGRELVALAGLEGERVTAPLSRFVRWLCIGGRLVQVPQTPPKILMAPLMPWRDKIRVLGDLRRPYLEGEPSVARWVAHRFGPALLPFADAVITGTWAGDIERLVIDGVMPALRGLEREHGSIIRALFARARERKKSGAPKRGLPAMQSFQDGMERLPLALGGILQEAGSLRLNSGVERIGRDGDGWLVQCGQESVRCRELVLALSVNAGLALLPDTVEAPPVSALPEARIESVLLGFGPEAKIPFGFGYLAPEREGRFALGALFSTHMFPGRAPSTPAGGQLLEFLVGGRRHPERLELSDDEMIARTLADARGLIDLPEAPRFAHVLRTPAGIPQAEGDYPRLLKWREDLAAREPRLHLLGFGWQGIGINEMIREAKNLALRLAGGASAADAPLKGVYV